MPDDPTGPCWTALTADPIDLGAVWAFLQDERIGGTCVFVGTPRRWTGEQETDALSYEAFDAMVDAELARLADHAQERWNVIRLVLLHRTGTVGLTDPSVVVGVGCLHRAEAFEAARWLIDTLKEDLPIWKTEHAPTT